MADKQLDDAAWKSFAGKHEIIDPKLAKQLTDALARLARAGKEGPQQVLAALDDVDKQLEALVKKDLKADKDAVKQLDDMRKSAAEQRKEAVKALADAQAKAADDDEADTPVLLTTKMAPLLRELRKGEARMHALVGTAGKNTAVLIMRRAIAPARRKLLAEAVDAKGGTKYIAAECLYESGMLTFVVQSKAGGLAKRIKAALFDQVALRLKVRVRGEDPSDVDEDAEGDETPDVEGRSDTAPASTTTPVAPSPDGPDAGGGPAPTPEALAYARQHERLQPLVEQALKDKHPESTKLRAVSGFADDKADAGDHAGAIKALLMLEKLLAAGDKPGSSSGGDNAALDDALQAWRTARGDVVRQLQAMAAELKEDREDDPTDELAREAEVEVNAVMRQLTAEPSTLQQVAELSRWVAQDDVVTDVDAHVGNVRAPLSDALLGLRRAFGQPN